ncbi:dihydrolipoyl dehydrogenase family protein [Streptococcus halichoeri]|uniref:dihydrolipoyl dehydrogenase family protein n=1 Tax=Streptococcus halichoeri TaxID=254785 RepID=UPI00135C5CF0|nr:NAD(P)/FAD-dependent oxidoreductase [Streptococcus halichoeri]
MYQYDVTFIGSGHASWHAAILLRKFGKKVAIIESDLTAGTCTNYGCNAKFLLESPFEYLDGLSRYEKAGIATSGHISWEKLMDYKKEEINSYAPAMEQLFAAQGIDLIKGKGHLIDDHTVGVDKQEITSDKIVIATGQRSARLNVPGNEQFHDSRDFLSLDKMPKRMTIIGAGIISLEFATMATKLGTEVHIIEFGDRALAAYPKDYVQTIVDTLTEEGAVFHFNEAVTQATVLDDGSYVVKTDSGLTVETDYILDATGRIANTEDLGLEALGIETDRGGIVVNDHLQTAVPNIFASGDVVSKKIPKLTPTATFESNYIASVILGNSDPIQYPAIPNVVFTMPRLSQVGVTNDEAKAHPDDYRVVDIPFGQQLKFQTKLEENAKLTLVIGRDKTLKGATMLGGEAGEMVNLLTLIINQGLGAKELNAMIFAFPGVSSGVLTSLIQALNE